MMQLTASPLAHDALENELLFPDATPLTNHW
jgi:hypothetical protein